MTTTEQKLDDILKSVHTINLNLNTHLIHQQQHRKELDEHHKKIDNLIAIKNKGIGISIIGGTGLGAFFSWLFRH